jgi:uncharacterized protein (DUF4415 family)
MGKAKTKSKPWERPEFDDSPELTKAQMKAMRPIEEVLPGVAATFKRSRGRPKAAAPLAHVSLRLEPAVLKAFRALGPRWQTEMRAVLKKAAAGIARKRPAESKGRERKRA